MYGVPDQPFEELWLWLDNAGVFQNAGEIYGFHYHLATENLRDNHRRNLKDVVMTYLLDRIAEDRRKEVEQNLMEWQELKSVNIFLQPGTKINGRGQGHTIEIDIEGK